MYIKIDELKNAKIKREYKAWLEIGSGNTLRGVTIEVIERAVTKIGEEEYEICKDMTQNSFSTYSISSEKEKIVQKVKTLQLDLEKELNAIIDLLTALGIEEVEISKDP